MANIQLFPGHRLSPDGKEFRLFENEEDVPAGWLRESPESYVKKGLKPTRAKSVKEETSNDEIDL